MTRPVLLALGVVLAVAGPARAHRLNVEARVEGGRVRVDVYFSDGTAPAGADVVVTRDGEEVARGQTDAAGAFWFAPPAAGRYGVAVTEPGLHRGQVEVLVADADLDVDLAEVAPLASVAAPGTASAGAPPAERSGGEWGRALVGVLVIVILAAGLGAWQRRRPV